MNLTERRTKKARERRSQIKATGKAVAHEHNLVRRSGAHPSSRVKAIAAMCYQGYGGTEEELPDAGWRELIRACTSPTCALHRHRPYR